MASSASHQKRPPIPQRNSSRPAFADKARDRPALTDAPRSQDELLIRNLAGPRNHRGSPNEEPPVLETARAVSLRKFTPKIVQDPDHDEEVEIATARAVSLQRPSRAKIVSISPPGKKVKAVNDPALDQLFPDLALDDERADKPRVLASVEMKSAKPTRNKARYGAPFWTGKSAQ